jgi:L,D-transpeptidase YbiS
VVLRIEVIVSEQRLRVYDDSDSVVMDVSVATAAKGIGQQLGSEQTPLGRHIVRAKIGAGSAEGTVFVARRPTGEIFSEALRQAEPDRDWILTRILWLSGTEPGLNRLGTVDTMRRYIYIHGAPDADAMGIPSSHGCVKMRNSDIIELFEKVPVGTVVDIVN